MYHQPAAHPPFKQWAFSFLWWTAASCFHHLFLQKVRTCEPFSLCVQELLGFADQLAHSLEARSGGGTAVS